MLSNFIFHHIGVAVKSIEETAAVYVAGGYVKSSVTFDSIQKVNICWLTKEGMPMVELLEPVEETSPVNNTLDKMDVTPYHTCYIVYDINEAILMLRKQRYVALGKPVEAVAISGCKVCFLFNKNVGLIELVEAPATIIE